jgi:HlyD family secretion protein
MTRLLVPILLVAALLAACSSRRENVSANATPTAKAAQTDLRITVKASGSIQATNSTRIVPTLKRGVAIEFIVPDGQRVKEGDVIARFNTEEIDRYVKDTELRVADQEVKVDGAKTDLEVQQMENAAQLRQAEQEVQNAAKELEKFIQADSSLETRNATVKTDTTRRQLARLERRAGEIVTLLKDGFVTEDQVEEEKIAMEEARLTAETAVAELSVLTNYSLPLREARLRTAVDKAQTEQDKRKKSNLATQRQKEQAVAAANQLLDRNRTELQNFRQELAACTVRAPTDGLVIYGDPAQPWRRSEILVGSRIQPGQSLVTIPDMDVMKAVVNVSESTASMVVTQQTAVVTVEAAAGQAFTGAVMRISEVANSQNWWEGDVKEFSCDVSLPDAKGLKPGLSCTAQILVETLPNTLCVPVQAVFRREREFIVYVMSGGASRATPVRVGKSSDTLVQILDGLKPGEEVALVRPPDAKTP